MFEYIFVVSNTFLGELMSSLTFEGDPRTVEYKKEIIFNQLVNLGLVGLAALFWLVAEQFFPDFFSPNDWANSTNDPNSILLFWPLFVYSFVLAIWTTSGLRPSFMRSSTDEMHLKIDLGKSLLAGIWEELGFRWCFIIFAMMSIVISNFFFFWIILILALIGAAVCLISAYENAGRRYGDPILVALSLLGAVICAAIIYLVWDLQNPVYWFYENVVFNVLWFLSFGLIEPIIYYEDAPFLFIAGAITANSWFRDGHKYQGVFGWLNSWVAGFILIYIMLYHGILVAIAVHAIYNMIHAVTHYVGRKLN